MLVSFALPNIIAGVSQQPPALRLPNAHEELINAWTSPVSGMQKRPPTKVVAKLGSALATSVRMQTYNDPVSAQTFFIMASDHSFRVFNQLGVEKTVTGSAAGAYFNFGANPKLNCRMVTQGDTTFILNRTIVPAVAALTEAAPRVNPANRWTIFVSEAVPNAYYTLYVNGVSKASFLTANNLSSTTPVEKTSVIAENLRTQLVTAGYTVTRYNSTLALIVPAAGVVSVYQDGDAGKALKAYSTAVQDFSNLPPQEEVGRVLTISADANTPSANYYVQFSSDGRWVETYAYGAGRVVDNTTLPWTLTYNHAGDTFTLAQHTWGTRLVGDDLTDPPPAFFGNKINSMSVYDGRMLFLADENAVLSQAEVYENFWRTTVVQLLDSDPIDLSVVSGRVSFLNHAVPFNKRLVIFGDQTQYILDGGNILSPTTAVAAFTTSFPNSITTAPINIGPYVYYIDDTGSYLKLMEYFSDNNAQTENADDASVQVQQYMKGPVQGLTGDTRLNAVIIQGADQTQLYTYRFAFGGTATKVESAWGTWQFLGSVQAFEFVGNYLYLFVNYSDGVYLERMLMEENVVRTALSFPIDLDHSTTLGACSAVSYSAATGLTTFTTPYAYPAGVTMVLAPAALLSGVEYPMTNTSGNTYTVLGDVTAHTDAVIGITYTFQWKLSTQYAREMKRNGLIPTGWVIMQDGRLTLRYMSLQYIDTSAFVVRVTIEDGTYFEYPFEGRTLGASNNVLGGVSIDTGTFKFPIMARNEHVQIEVHNSSPYHCTFTACEWQGQYRPRSLQRF
jgi:hypothetical protein